MIDSPDGCVKRYPFPNRFEATKAAKEKRPIEYHVYECHVCGSYHIGPGKEKK